eukprot:gene20641-biopygen20618
MSKFRRRRTRQALGCCNPTSSFTPKPDAGCAHRNRRSGIDCYAGPSHREGLANVHRLLRKKSQPPQTNDPPHQMTP